MPPRLSRFQIADLFGLYTHDILLEHDERVTAIIGPNGLGKTTCLKLINALFNSKYSTFYTVEFSACKYEFNDGSLVEVTRDNQTTLEEVRDEDAPAPSLKFSIRFRDGRQSEWQIAERASSQRRRFSDIERYLPFLTQISPDTWMDDYTGQRLRLIDIIDRFKSHLPPSFRNIWPGEQTEELSKLLGNTKCRLIETQRLLVAATSEEENVYRRRPIAPDITRLAVERKAQILRTQIAEILTQYASLSQSLDRSLPRRILTNNPDQLLARTEIDAKLSDLELRRRALEGAGILAPENESVTAVPNEMSDDIQRVISIYVNDTQHKLDIFGSLQKKIELFEELIKQRFIDKHISINREEGFKVVTNKGKVVPLSALSSGEQHQLVLIFELLFETARGDLILIDEPEISLHVSWQKNFINDILRIIDANPFDAILATHSPVLIGHHFDLAVELKGAAE